MILRIVLAAACLFAEAAFASADVLLSRDGKSSHVIVVADAATAPDERAAHDLQDYLKQVTGAQLPILKESDLAGNDAPRISVGRTKLATQAMPDLNWEPLANDGIVIRTVGDSLFLAGGGPRGTLYAVNTFLEAGVGVRWWTSDETTIPHTPTLTIPDQNVTYVPKLRYREAFYHDGTGGGDRAVFASRLKLNGQHNTIPPDLGGHYTLIGWCHTSFDLIPPGEYFAKHPEWFAMVKGKRQTESQLCLSNPEMRKQLIANVLDRVRKRPDAGIISISQNDCLRPCECDDCRAILAEESAESGAWVRLCNDAADAINKEYPGFLVETLAYQYTRKPPTKTRPNEHVLVRLCSIEADFAHPLAGESNKSFGDDLRGWSAIAPNLFVWNYVTNFFDYLVPHPNLLPVGDDLRFFTDHHVVGVFEQGDYYNDRAGDMLPLRLWLMAHLMWDPSKDQEKLTHEFLDGYFGPAGKPLAEYLAVVNEVAKDPKIRIYCGHNNINWLKPDALARMNQLFDDAEKSVAGNADFTRRVRRERLALEHVNLLRYDFAARIQEAGGDAKPVLADYRKRARAWVADANAAGVHMYSEMQGFEAYGPSIEMRGENLAPPTLPAPGAQRAPGEFDVQQDQFTLYKRPKKSDLVDDAKASDGRAARMPGDQTDWAIQFHVPKDAKFAAPGPWMCYIVARCEGAKNKSGSAFLYGLHAPKRVVSMNRASLSVAGDGEYHAYAIPVQRLEPGSYFFVAPIDIPNVVPSVSVDRIFIRRATEDSQ